MGADGGSIPDRSDLVRTKGKGEVTDRALLRELFFICALSRVSLVSIGMLSRAHTLQRPLVRPVVLDPLGKLYNKDAVLEFLLDRSQYGDGDRICGYLRGVKVSHQTPSMRTWLRYQDLLTLKLTPNPTYTSPDPSTTANASQRAPFACPLSLKEMSGTVPFIALRPCGCVFSEAAVRAVIPNLARITTTVKSFKDEVPDSAQPVAESIDVVACPNCGQDIRPAEAATVSPINPPKEYQEDLLESLLMARAAVKAGKKRKAGAITPCGAKLGVAGESEVSLQIPDSAQEAESSRPRSKAARLAPLPVQITASDPTNSGRQSVAQKLAAQEQKRLVAQAGMSDAVKSMFKAKETEKSGGGAADFFGRTFTRVSDLLSGMVRG